MRRAFCLALGALLCLGLAGCGRETALTSSAPITAEDYTADEILAYFGEIAVLTDLTERLNTIPGFPGARRTENEEDANFKIHFVMQNELTGWFGDAAASASGMSRFTWQKSNGKILRAEAGIACNITPMNAKASVICEEFLQSLGLSTDSYSYPESVFYQGYNGALRPAEIDWALVALLYSDAIAPGASYEDAMETTRFLLGVSDPAAAGESTENP